jgi:ATP-dependent RNA circularization protein (DNA/RNA ligase family)
MTVYHKIDAPFMRDQKGKMLHGQWCRPEFEYLANNDWEFTEKVDGTNIRICVSRVEDYATYEIRGRTDNAQIPPALTVALTRLISPIIDSIGAIMVVRNIDELVIYGEGYGPKINGGDRYRDDPSFAVFDIKVEEFWLYREAVNDFCKEVGLDSVPVIGHGTLYDAFDMVKAGITSQWGDFEAEGIVATPSVPLFNRQSNRIITKIKHVDFRR